MSVNPTPRVSLRGKVLRWKEFIRKEIEARDWNFKRRFADQSLP